MKQPNIVSARHLRHALWFPAFVALLFIALGPPRTAICLAPVSVVSVAALIRTLGRTPDRGYIGGREYTIWSLVLAGSALASVALLEVF